MIENALFFLAGAAMAGLVALLLVPAVSARAVRLYRQNVERSMPRTLAEVAAAQDAVRAEMAAKAARSEFALQRTSADLVAARLAQSAMASRFEALRAERGSLADNVAELEARLSEAHAAQRADREELTRQAMERRDLERRLASRESEVAFDRTETEVREEGMRRALEEADAKIATLTDMVNDYAWNPVGDDCLLARGEALSTEVAEADEAPAEAASETAAVEPASEAAAVEPPPTELPPTELPPTEPSAALPADAAAAPADFTIGSDDERMAAIARRLRVLRERGAARSGLARPAADGEAPARTGEGGEAAS